MKTYRCSHCGHELKRPAQPYSCPQCGRQAVGLFKVVSGGGQGDQAGIPPTAPATPAKPAGPPAAEIGVPPAQGRPPSAGHGGISPIAAPPPPPGTPAPPRAATPPAQPAQPPPARPVPQPPTGPSRPSPAQPARPPARRPPPKQAQPPQAAPPPLPRSGSGGPPRPATPPQSRPGARPKVRRPAKPAAPRPAARHPERTRPAPAPKPEPPKPRPRVRPEVLRPKEFVWAYPEEPPYNVDAKPMKNAPAVDPEGRILFCAQGRLLAVEDQGEGPPKILWDYVVGSHVPGPVVVAPDGSIRVHSADGFLHAVSSAGKQVWAPARVGEPLGWAAPVCDQQGNTYVSAYDGGLLRVSAEGKMGRRPYFRSRRKFDSAGVIHGGVLYVGAEDGYIFAIRLDTDRGENIWEHAAEQGFTGGYLNSSPAVSEEGVLVVAAREETLYGFSPSGAALWATKMPGMMLASPVIDPYGHVYVGVSQAQRGQEPRGLLVSVDGNSHKIRWQYTAAGPVESTPVIGDDETIYFGDNSGTIHAVDTRGNSRWTAKVEAAIRSAGTIVAPARLAFGLDDDTLVVLKCSSGELAPGGWPKIACTLAQTGMTPPGTATYGAYEPEPAEEETEQAPGEHAPSAQEPSNADLDDGPGPLI